jgi:hypothetical protein
MAKDKAYEIYNRYKNSSFSDAKNGAFDLYTQCKNSTYYSEAKK